MRLPGRAWLEFDVRPNHGGSVVRQTAVFDPRGVGGRAYWYLTCPLHKIVFAGMLKAIIAAGIRMTGCQSATWRPSLARQLAWLFGLLTICFAAAGIGGVLTSTSVGDWYQALEKPRWTPPDWVFGPVWSVLYALMGIAAWFVWRKGGWTASRTSLLLFGVQLVLNVAWSAIFFALRSPGLAMAEIVILWLAIVATAISFWGRSSIAALLFVPYLAWATFATLLNFAIWRMHA
jgi:tryptophan-rich sensory protein